MNASVVASLAASPRDVAIATRDSADVQMP